MQGGFNSVARVHAVLKRAAFGHNPNTRVGDVWAVVFSIDESNTTERYYTVTELLQTLYREVQLAEKALGQTRIQNERFDPVFQTIYECISPLNMASPWNGALNNLVNVLDRLAIFGDVIVDDGAMLDPEALAEFRVQLIELEQDVRASTLPLDVQRFFLEQIGIMLKALRAYPIAGNKIFEDALGDYVVSRYRNDEAFKKAKEDSEGSAFLDRLGKAWVWCWARAQEGTTAVAIADIVQRMLAG